MIFKSVMFGFQYVCGNIVTLKLEDIQVATSSNAQLKVSLINTIGITDFVLASYIRKVTFRDFV